MRRKPQQQRSERMVAIIGQATLELIGERGIERVTTRHIADRAGISVGTFYHYYADRDDVLRSLERQFVSDLLEQLQQATPDIVQLEIGAAVREIAHIYRQALARDGGSWLALIRPMLRRGVELTGEVERVFNQLGLLYLNRHPELAAVRDFPKVVYILLNACIFNLMRHVENPPPHIGPEALIDGLVDMSVAYVESQRLPALDSAR